MAIKATFKQPDPKLVDIIMPAGHRMHSQPAGSPDAPIMETYFLLDGEPDCDGEWTIYRPTKTPEGKSPVYSGLCIVGEPGEVPLTATPSTLMDTIKKHHNLRMQIGRDIERKVRREHRKAQLLAQDIQMTA